MLRLALALGLTLATLAAAANPKATALAKEADKLYRENKYREAAQRLQEAWALEPSALYVYNIARAYDQAGELELSLEHYRKYVGLPSRETQPDLVKKANLAMDRLRTLVAKGEADKTVREAEKQRLEDDARKAEERADAEADAARKQRREFEAKEKLRKEGESKTLNTRKLGAFIAGGVGVAALGTSLGFALGANGTKSAFREATTLADKQRLEGETRTLAAVTDVALLIGLAGVTTAAILFPWGGDEPDKRVTVVLAPVAGGAVAGVGGTF